MNDQFRKAARKGRIDAVAQLDPVAQKFGDWIRRPRGAPPPAPSTEPVDPVEAMAAKRGFRNPELAARAIAESNDPAQALSDLAVAMPYLLGAPVDSGLGPRGKPFGGKSTSTAVNDAIRSATGRPTSDVWPKEE